MAGGTFEIVCNGCKSSVPADAELCPRCGIVLIGTDERPVGRAHVPTTAEQMPDYQDVLARQRAWDEAFIARARERSPGLDPELHRPAYAGFWIRVVAQVIDVAALMALLFLFALVRHDTVSAHAAAILFLVVVALYYPLMESSRRQATFGKGLCGLAVTDTHGRRISFLRAVVRLLARIPAGILGLGYLLVAVTPRKRGLHDYIAGTLVLRRGLY